eukprot:Sdes_comp17804_c0_seq1m7068
MASVVQSKVMSSELSTQVGSQAPVKCGKPHKTKRSLKAPIMPVNCSMNHNSDSALSESSQEDSEVESNPSGDASGSSAGEESEIENLTEDEEILRNEDGVHSTMAGAMKKLLETTKAQAPILSKDKSIEKRLLLEKEERNSKRLKIAANKTLLEKEHIQKPDPLKKDYEKKLLKIATKGVVQLFNAVSQIQKEAVKRVESAGETVVKKEKALQSLSHTSFIELLRKNNEAFSKMAQNNQPPKTSTDSSKPWKILTDD